MCIEKKNSADIGRLGEKKVANYLKNKGYIIVKRNWRDRYGEIDIIAENEKYLVFVEVKTRRKGAMVSGLEAIDAGKIKRTRNAAVMFAKRLNADLIPRIDVAEVTVDYDDCGKSHWEVKYLKSAM